MSTLAEYKMQEPDNNQVEGPESPEETNTDLIEEVDDLGVDIADIPPRRLQPVRGAPGDGEWLWAGIRGDRVTRSVEANAAVSLGGRRLAAARGAATVPC